MSSKNQREEELERREDDSLPSAMREFKPFQDELVPTTRPSINFFTASKMLYAQTG
jgi:hypothetical protein